MTYLSLPILAIAAILQASVVPLFSTNGIGPNLVFVIVLAWSINATFRQALVWAVVGGILLDLLSAIPTGTSAIAMIAVVFAISGIGGQFYRVGLLLLAITTLFGSFFFGIYGVVMIEIYQFIGWLPTDISGFNPNWVDAVTTFVLPVTLYNVVLVIPVYILLRQIQRRGERQ